MKQATQHLKSGNITVEEVPVPVLKPGFVLVRTRYSLISAGTERASVQSRKMPLLQRARKQPELVLKVLEQIRQYGIVATYRRVRNRLETSTALGYSVAGTVVAVGDGQRGLKPGDRVACMGSGYASHAEYVVVPQQLCARVPNKVDLLHASYGTVGAIAMQGVRLAEPTLGETIVVIGLGLIGQIAIQLLAAAGCRVIGIDLDETALGVAKRRGADLVLNRRADDVKNSVAAFTRGHGADAVVITAASPTSDPVQLAGELCRDRGRVVLVGDVRIDLPRGPYYMKELDFRVSRSTGPGRYDPMYEEAGTDYPIGYVRWTEQRNMEEFLRLLAERKIEVGSLTTHRFPIDDARNAFGAINAASGKKRGLGVVLDYGDAGERPSSSALLRSVKLLSDPSAGSPQALGIGFIGAGSFAQASLLPHVQRFPKVALVAVSGANGLNAKNVAKTYGFRIAATDEEQVLSREDVGTVFIATRHNLHAPMVVKALKSGKNVFVEKPLALSEVELREILTAYQHGAGARRTSGKQAKGASPPSGLAPVLMVGFNRRFAPHIQHVKRFFQDTPGPFMIEYTVNAGYIPGSHWVRDPVEGGGRIIGEVCHFVDLAEFLTASAVVKVYAAPLAGGEQGRGDDDSVAIVLSFEDNSVATITYRANNDASAPKERVEISAAQRSAVVDNFKTLMLYQGGRRRVFSRRAIDKGHRDEVAAFLTAVRDGKPSPIPPESAFRTTMATFRILDSLRAGVPVQV